MAQHPGDEVSNELDLRAEIATALRALNAMASGWYEVQQQEDGTWTVINQAGYTHTAPLEVAKGMTEADARGLVHARNYIPQLLQAIG